MTDPIRDMFTRIRNAQAVSKKTVTLPFSKFKWQILKVLKDEHYVEEFIRRGRKNKKFIEVVLGYDEESRPRISSIEPMSKQSRRMYWGVADMRSARSGMGIYVVSTSKGVMSSYAAKKMNVGGEVICEIW